MKKVTSPAIIVGGGPVSSILAIALYKAGIDFLWFGKPAQPLQSMCYALHPKHIHYLTTLGIQPKAHPIPMMRLRHNQKIFEINGTYSKYEHLCLITKQTDLINAYEKKLIELGIHPQPYQSLLVQDKSLMIDQILYTSPYIVAADGFHSPIREQLQIHTHTHDPNQLAHIALITHYEKMHHAYQSFTTEGSFALLPISSHQSNLIWCTDHTTDKAIRSQGLKSQLEAPLAQAGLNLVEMKHHHSIRIICKQADTYYKDNIALAGSALHSIHPIAGLGLNLGIGDIRCLLDLIIQQAPLCRYTSQRTPAHQYAQHICQIAAKSRHYNQLTDKLYRLLAYCNNPLTQSMIIATVDKLC